MELPNHGFDHDLLLHVAVRSEARTASALARGALKVSVRCDADIQVLMCPPLPSKPNLRDVGGSNRGRSSV
jgi:hypothetical protein